MGGGDGRAELCFDANVVLQIKMSDFRYVTTEYEDKLGRWVVACGGGGGCRIGAGGRGNSVLLHSLTQERAHGPDTRVAACHVCTDDGV
jgi:hypothetical protein